MDLAREGKRTRKTIKSSGKNMWVDNLQAFGQAEEIKRGLKKSITHKREKKHFDGILYLHVTPRKQ